MAPGRGPEEIATVELVYEGEAPVITAATGGVVVHGQKVSVEAGQVEGLLAQGFTLAK